MRAMDVMTSGVITVEPTTSVQALAVLLSEKGISGVPVVDADRRVIGVVSEGDLIHRTETGTERRIARRRARWFDRSGEQELAQDYVKAHGRTVGDIMTHNVVSVEETAELADVAMLMERNRIKRVPVISDGKLVGIISRANLVRALAAAKGALAASDADDDRTIRSKLIAELNGREWVHAWAADIVVKDGVVHLWVSEDRSGDERQALRIAAENTPGVRGVEEHVVPASPYPAF
jgi:CBS domain-containing protein